MNSPWKELFLLFKEERKQLLIFFVLIVIILIFKWNIPNWFPSDDSFLTETKLTFDKIETGVEVSKRKPLDQNIKIDINTDDTLSWVALGFSRRQSEIIINYKNIVGGFDSLSELNKVYIVDEEKYASIKNHLYFKARKVDNEPAMAAEEQRIEAKNREVELTPFPFDPNTVTRNELKKMGLKEHQVKNWINYREKVGLFGSKEELLKLYALSETEFVVLEPYISLEEPTEEELGISKEEIVLDLNHCDSLSLVAINGIGPYYSHLILDYRNRLGGFHSVKQLYEISKIRKETIDKCYHLFKVESEPNIEKIDLNSDNFQLFLKHPYFDYYHTKKIFDYKNEQGKFTSLRDLNKVGFIEPDYVDQITPYLKIESDTR